MKRAHVILALAAVLSAAATLPACGPSKPPARTAHVTPGTLPSGESFKGVWYNAFRGELHMVQSGNSVQGRWRSKENGRWGKLTGTVTGDVIRFQFEEFKTGMVGPGAKSVGKGYFKFVPAEPPDTASIKGEWGFDDNETGSEWEAKRMKDIEPNMDAVKVDDDPTVDTGWDAPAGGKK